MRSITLLLMLFLMERSSAQRLLKDINRDDLSSLPQYLASSDSNFIFTAIALNQRELWISDGTTQGTQLLKDIAPGPGSSMISMAKWIQGFGYVFVDEISSMSRYNNLWKSDGTPEGTVLLKDSLLDFFDLRSNLIYFKDRLYFYASDETYGSELWVSEGNENSTQLFKDIKPGKTGSGANWLTIHSDSLFYFVADDSTFGNEIWVSDGTEQGTHLAFDLNPGIQDGILPNNINTLVSAGGKIYLIGSVGDSIGTELYVYDEKSKDIHLVHDFCDNFLNIHSGATLMKYNDSLFFVNAFSNDFIYKFWRGNGNDNSLVQAKFKDKDSSENFFYNAINLRGKTLYVVYQRTNGTELWTEQPDFEQLDILLNFIPGDNSGCCYIQPVVSGPYAYYIVHNGIGFDLWQTNGENAHTSIFFNLLSDHNPTYMITLKNKLFLFAKLDIKFGHEIYTLDLPTDIQVVKATNKYNIYPNPVASGSYMMIDHSETSSIFRLFDLNGKVIQLKEENGRIYIPEFLSQGLYTLTVQSADHCQTIKISIL